MCTYVPLHYCIYNPYSSKSLMSNIMVIPTCRNHQRHCLISNICPCRKRAFLGTSSRYIYQYLLLLLLCYSLHS
ncbi:hypothetical protein LZ32DRAFT_227182 [Colletotrichum eremochloae]|nr:hypothetical protein LZ32DRAFT_227182 [Colletotrichum eremochloae]